MIDISSVLNACNFVLDFLLLRLVNCFVAHKKTKCSISELADAAGIPRVLVDIRHGLMGTTVLRVGNKLSSQITAKLQSSKNGISPSSLVREEDGRRGERKERKKRWRDEGEGGKERKRKEEEEAQEEEEEGGKGDEISKIVRIIARLYSSYPSEVVSVLLEFFQLQSPGISESIDIEQSDDSNVGVSGSTSSMDELKSIITKLSSKRPRLLLSMLKNVLEMIEVNFEKIQKGEYDIYSSQDHANIHHMSNLCSLSPWLIINIKMLKDSDLIRLTDEAEVLPIHKNILPKVSLSMLLRKCLTLSVHDKHLLDSVRLLVEMLGDTLVKERLKKLPLLSLKSLDSMEGPTYPDTGSMLLQEEGVVKNVTDNLEIMKLKLKSRRKRINGSDSDTTSVWTVAKSWTSCPIGMLPCSFSSTAVLPLLDKFDNELETDVGTNKDTVLNGSAASDGILDCHTEPSEVGNAFKKLKPSLDDVQCVDCSETTCPMEGRLLINGMWIKVSEEELQAIESNITTFC
ncbi:hypothetical protein BHM03_00024027 [Ensete ventricosum]|nr:hypothetical protein BHM03_00024027 [Ensete ventricosum]